MRGGRLGLGCSTEIGVHGVEAGARRGSRGGGAVLAVRGRLGVCGAVGGPAQVVHTEAGGSHKSVGTRIARNGRFRAQRRKNIAFCFDFW